MGTLGEFVVVVALGIGLVVLGGSLATPHARCVFCPPSANNREARSLFPGRGRGRRSGQHSLSLPHVRDAIPSAIDIIASRDRCRHCRVRSERRA